MNIVMCLAHKSCATCSCSRSEAVERNGKIIIVLHCKAKDGQTVESTDCCEKYQ